MIMKLRQGDLRRRLMTVMLALLLACSPVLGWPQQQSGSSAATVTSALTAQERELSESVKLETIKEVTAALSSEAMQGRGTMQPGGDKAANYIAERFSKLGLKPLGDKNSYLQAIKFRETVFLPETSLKVGDATLKMGSDFGVAPPLSGDKDASGQMVFVAYGLASSTPKRNDFAGIDIRGKVVVMLEGPPKGVSKEDWKKAKAQMTILID
ncbi:MAG: hypothetical protein LC731_09130, partial [Acidobacteria bacterium]|nr:hypothetical protein [Acidobacteriota bacterium]